jgi:hypothetical protein
VTVLRMLKTGRFIWLLGALIALSIALAPSATSDPIGDGGGGGNAHCSGSGTVALGMGGGKLTVGYCWSAEAAFYTYQTGASSPCNDVQGTLAQVWTQSGTRNWSRFYCNDGTWRYTDLWPSNDWRASYMWPAQGVVWAMQMYAR